MYQTWAKLLFIHWAIEPALLRNVVPRWLEIDTFGGKAWVSVTPFTMPSIRPPLLPAPPLVGRSHELNVRTYVMHQGVPGIWFFSLDAHNALAVLGARAAFHLPYFRASIDFR